MCCIRVNDCIGHAERLVLCAQHIPELECPSGILSYVGLHTLLQPAHVQDRAIKSDIGGLFIPRHRVAKRVCYEPTRQLRTRPFAEYMTIGFGAECDNPKESTMHYVSSARDEGSHNSTCSEGTRPCCLESRPAINVGGRTRDGVGLTR